MNWKTRIKNLDSSWVIILLVIIVWLFLNFLIIGGLTWLICFGFDIAFNWKVVVGVFAAYLLISSVSSNRKAD